MSRRPFVLPSPRDPHCLRLDVRAPGRRYRRHCPGPIRGAITAGGGPGSRAGSDADADARGTSRGGEGREYRQRRRGRDPADRQLGQLRREGLPAAGHQGSEDLCCLLVGAGCGCPAGGELQPGPRHRRGFRGALERGPPDRGSAGNPGRRELRIEVVDTSPGPDCMTTSALTQPVDVVLVPADGVKGWSFIDRKATNEC